MTNTINRLRSNRDGGFKLTRADVRKILAARARKYPAKILDLSKRFGVSKTMIQNIVKGKSWAERS